MQLLQARDIECQIKPSIIICPVVIWSIPGSAAQAGTRSLTRPMGAKVSFADAGTSWICPLEPDVLVLMTPPVAHRAARDGTHT